MTTKPAFPALGAPMLPAWVHGSPHVEDLALPKSLNSGNFTPAEAFIRWMSVEPGTELENPNFAAMAEALSACAGSGSRTRATSSWHRCGTRP